VNLLNIRYIDARKGGLVFLKLIPAESLTLVSPLLYAVDRVKMHFVLERAP